MEEIILEAIERTKQPGKFRENGFVPGVLYGDSITGGTSVKFNEIAMKKIISNHGNNAKVWIKFNDTKKYGFIKEVQKNTISRTLTHIDIQIVSKDHEIKLQIPIVFTGEEDLKHNQLQLQAYKSDVTVLGKMALMPDTIYVDVSKMNIGDNITIINFELDEKLTVMEKEDTLYGTIIHLKNQSVEEIAETETK